MSRPIEIKNIVSLIKSWLTPKGRLHGDKAIEENTLSSDKVKVVVTSGSDPSTLYPGMLWYRSDLERLSFTPDGSSVYRFERIPIRTDAIADAAVTSAKINIDVVTSDPSLRAGLIWYRSDLEQLSFSPDGSTVVRFERVPIRTDAIADGAITNAKIASGAVTLDKLATDAIKLKVPIIVLPDVKSVAVDSTGVKWSSAKFKLIPKAQVKDVILRTSFTSSVSDYTLAVYVKDLSSGNKVVEVSGTNLSDAEASASDQGTLGNLTDDGLLEVDVEVTTASGTSGATADIAYIVVEVIYGFA